MSAPHDEALALARVRLAAGEFAAAEEAAQTAFEAWPSAEAAIALAEARLGLGQIARAEQAASFALERAERGPATRAALLALGRARLARKAAREAVEAFQEALGLDERSSAARYGLAEALLAAGDPVRASAQLHLLLRQAPDHPGAAALREKAEAAAAALHAPRQEPAPPTGPRGGTGRRLSGAPPALAAFDDPVGGDGFGTSSDAEAYLAAFRTPPPAEKKRLPPEGGSR